PRLGDHAFDGGLAYKGKGTSEKRGHRLLPLLKVHSSDNSTLYALGFIGLFLLLIACINFVNLATAQATKRAKEVGVRKVLGSSSRQLIRQMMSETFLVTLIAFLLAIASAVLLLPFASRLIKVDISVSSLLKPVFLSFTISLLFVVSALSGWYPAWILSRFRPITALQNKVNLRRKNTFTLRQGMVTLQFVVAQIFIIGTIVVASQMHLFRSADLGFTSEAIITVPLPNQQAETLQTLRNRLLQLTSVQEISFSFNSPSAESNYMGELIYRTNDGETSIRTQFKLADTHFIDIYGIHLLAGKALQAGDTTGQVIVNEVFTQRMGLAQPEEAVGQYIDAGNQELIIQGVAQDFHVNSLHQNIDPTIIKLSPQHYYQAGIKIQTSGTQAGIQQGLQNVEEVWTDAFPKQLFSYQFLDETLAQAYERETQTMRLLNVFAVIAILISCLGLYGLVSFMAVQRTKEVGIRKVLGASINHILKLFSQEFIVLVAIAFIVAAPIGYYAMNQWLQDFAYRTSINWWMYGIAGGLVLFIALLTVNIQAIKAALANPVDSLRNE
ncbi:MAG: FtsX-like permease family protein, partial [Bacteroidota bacterium]